MATLRQRAKKILLPHSGQRKKEMSPAHKAALTKRRLPKNREEVELAIAMFAPPLTEQRKLSPSLTLGKVTKPV